MSTLATLILILMIICLTMFVSLIFYKIGYKDGIKGVWTRRLLLCNRNHSHFNRCCDNIIKSGKYPPLFPRHHLHIIRGFIDIFHRNHNKNIKTKEKKDMRTKCIICKKPICRKGRNIWGRSPLAVTCSHQCAITYQDIYQRVINHLRKK